MEDLRTRRQFVTSLALGAAGALAAVAPVAAAGEADVTPNEDLMREHGALNRILLIYEESDRRLAAGSGFDAAALSQAAGLIRRFIEGYHEKLEEQHVFPPLEKAGLGALARTLAEQHAAGRKVTAEVLELSTAKTAAEQAGRSRLSAALRSFIRMYRPHEAREDTVAFPAFKKAVGEKEYARLGDVFEDRERELLGKEGFEGVLSHVEALEKRLGIFELAQFTPR